MNIDDKKRFAVLMHWLAKKYPLGRDDAGVEKVRTLTQDDLRDWFDALKDIRIERLEWGAKYLYGHSKFFPRPPELREAAEKAPSTVVPAIKYQEKKALPSPEQREEQKRIHEEGARKLRESLEELNSKYGTSIQVGEGS